MTELQGEMAWVASEGGMNGGTFRLQIGGEDLGHFYPDCGDQTDPDKVMAAIAKAYNEVETLRQALRDVRDCVIRGGPGICDTVWIGPAETLVDRVNHVLDGVVVT